MIPAITKLETVVFEYTIENMGVDYNGFNLVYEKGGRRKLRGSLLRIHTNVGIVGEYLGGPSPSGVAVEYLQRSETRTEAHRPDPNRRH